MYVSFLGKKLQENHIMYIKYLDLVLCATDARVACARVRISVVVLYIECNTRAQFPFPHLLHYTAFLFTRRRTATLCCPSAAAVRSIGTAARRSCTSPRS